MITEFIKEKYIINKCQILVFDNDGCVTESDNFLFKIKLGQQVVKIHPFFETINYLVTDKNQEHVFHCINLEIGEVTGSYNIVFFSGSKELNPYLIFYDFTDNCNYLQTVVQKRNESAIALELQQLKEKQLINEKKFKNKFLANISHDLKTPLGAVLGFLEILEDTPLNPNQQDLIQTIKKSGNHIKSLIDDLLDLTKIEAGELKISCTPFSVHDLTNHIKKIYMPITASKKLTFNLNLKQNIPHFLISDKTRILQILINLLDNAFKFTDKGSVSLILESKQLIENLVELNFSVIDTGIGFPDDKQNSINSFTKFHQSDIDGSGLGLSIVQKLVENMGGKLQIQKNIPDGTCVKISIPMQVAIDNPVFDNQNQQKTILTQNHLKVLIADDNEINIMLLKKILNEYPNITIATANNGVEVLEIVEQIAFDFILMDIEMPIMNGLKANNQLKKHPNPAIAKIPVLAISANTGKNDIQKYMQAGMCGYISKPFLKQELFNAIQKNILVKQVL